MKNNNNIHTITTYLLCAACLLWTASARSAEIQTPIEAVFKAVNLQMLSQRIPKNYVMAGLGIRARKANEEMQLSISQFEVQMAELQRFVKDDVARLRLQELAAIWQSAKAGYLAPPDKAQAPAIQERSESLLQAAERLTRAVEQSSGLTNAHLVTLSGQQAMLSQRIAITYALMAWGYEAQYRDAYDRNYDLFGQTLDKLSQYPGNTPPITRAIDDVRLQLSRIQLAGKTGGDQVYVPSLLDRSSEKMLESINQLTGLYSGLAK